MWDRGSVAVDVGLEIGAKHFLIPLRQFLGGGAADHRGEGSREKTDQTMELMGDADAKDLRVGENGRESFFQLVLFGMLDGDEPSGGDDCIPEFVRARAGFI